MKLKLCSGNQIANGQTDRQTADARWYNIICPKFFRVYKKQSPLSEKNVPGKIAYDLQCFQPRKVCVLNVK
jgi:hypothetical protein